MSIQTYIAMSFGRSPEGHLSPRQYRDCGCETDALEQARLFGEADAGAIAISRLLDLDRGTSTPRLLHQVGEIPNLEYLLNR